MSKAPRALQLPGASAQNADELAQAGAAEQAGRPEGLTEAEELAALRAENARLKAAAAGPASKSVVYEPVTKHGAQALAASQYAGMTSAELIAKIEAGEAREPLTSVLCADGWYCSRVSRA